VTVAEAYKLAAWIGSRCFTPRDFIARGCEIPWKHHLWWSREWGRGYLGVLCGR
jgi:hypothetical protein